MDCALILADHAEVADSKLFINCGGWTWIGPQVGPIALGLIFDVDRNEANMRHSISIYLVDEDGQPVIVSPINQALHVSMDFEVGRPPGSIAGMPLTSSMAFNVGPLPLVPGKRSSWVVELASVTPSKTRRRQFAVRPSPPVSITG